MKRRAERLAPLVLVALLGAAALYRAIDTEAAAPSVLATQTPPEKAAAKPPARDDAAVAVLKVELPPPPPVPEAAAPKPAPVARPALRPDPPAPPKPQTPPRPALQPAPEAPAPAAKPRPALKRTALVPEKPKPVARPVPRDALKPAPPKPVPPSVPALKPRPEPAPKPAPEPRPVRAPAPEPVPERVAALPDKAPPVPAPDRAQVEKAGRSLLRILEHGKGPTIEIAWPDGSSARAALYRRLVDCHGMQVALMDGGGRLFAARGQPGTPWAINMDRYSGFVRQAEGRITAAERAAADRISAHHRLSSGAIVRVFPRGVDASLLGGLHGLLGEGYSRAGTIRGRYSIRGGRLFVTGITADGRAVSEAVALSPAHRGRCR